MEKQSSRYSPWDFVMPVILGLLVWGLTTWPSAGVLSWIVWQAVALWVPRKKVIEEFEREGR